MMLLLFLLISMLLQQGALSLGETRGGGGGGGERERDIAGHRQYRYRRQLRYPPLVAHQIQNHIRGQDAPAWPTKTSTTTITVDDCEETRPTFLNIAARNSSSLTGTANSEPRANATVSTKATSAFDPVTSTVSIITSTTSSGVVQILPSEQASSTTGTIQTTLQTEGHVSTQPIITSAIPPPKTLIPTSIATSTPMASPTTTMPAKVDNVFAHPIATDAPPSAIKHKGDHPVPRKGIKDSSLTPFQTNKFYSNFFLGNQHCPTYLFPYSVAWAKGSGAAASWGLAISHVEPRLRDFGKPEPVTGARKYYINPVGIQSVCLSAKELGPNTALTSDSLTDTSVRISLRPSAGESAVIQFPLVQGSAFITGVYAGAHPVVQTGIYFKTVTRSTQEAKPGITKFKLRLEDGNVWLLYAHHANGSAPLDLQVVNNGLAQAKGPFHGTIQVAKDPGGAEAVYDAACGAYSTGFDLSGGVHGDKGEYTFRFRKGGLAGATLAMFALPHHQSSFSAATKIKVTDVKLDTPTKGVATLVVADEWTMVEEELPVGVGFLPWSPQAGTVGTLSDSVKSFIHNITMQELSQNMVAQSNQNSMYFSGKALAKFATVALAAHDLLGDKPLAAAGLAQLKTAFARFSENRQQYPLVYESAWGGVVSSASYETGDSGVDFGNSYYNDHHFHYGYFIYAAAVIGYLDPSWIPINKPYVNTLVRDISNPSARDTWFPVWRCFDWYHGHSWAHGLFESLDGKDQESSSEDSMHAYAIKMWGTVSGDQHMAARGNLMLAVQARSFRDYYLYTESNTVQPAEFIGNKAAGILFENKIDHATYFGTNIEYIQGIHMLPLLPHTPFIRKLDFVAEEWKTYFDSGRADGIVGGWKGILFGNLATIDPRGAYAFFSTPGFDPSWLDGGASLTWYLCYAAALGGL